MDRSRPVPRVATALAVLSGAVLAWAGYLFARGHLTTALWVSIAPGITIEVAFAAIRRADRAVGIAAFPLRTRVMQEGVALVAGGAMALAGFAAADWSRLLVPAFALAGGALIQTAMTLGRGAVVHDGRFTAEIDGDFVVFLIGMRFNKPLKIHKWLPVARAMFAMLRVIDSHPVLGCLGYRQWGGLTTVMVQYWRDFESLDRFARDQTLPHAEPWRRFMRVIGSSGDVGVWHETYRVRAGEYETIYGNMPAFGLARAARHVPVARRGETARERITDRSRS